MLNKHFLIYQFIIPFENYQCQFCCLSIKRPILILVSPRFIHLFQLYSFFTLVIYQISSHIPSKRVLQPYQPQYVKEKHILLFNHVFFFFYFTMGLFSTHQQGRIKTVSPCTMRNSRCFIYREKGGVLTRQEWYARMRVKGMKC